MAGRGINGHHHARNGRTNDWLSPPEIVKALGPFDLDPCACLDMPWQTAQDSYTVREDGLSAPWYGRIWLNPPYGDQIARWMARMAEHRNGIALVFARTETAWFHAHVWPAATALLFCKGRIHFHTPDGGRSRDAVGPSVLIAYTDEDANVLAASGIAGYLVKPVAGFYPATEQLCR